MTRMLLLLRMAVVAVLLAVGVVSAAPVGAQDETVVADETTDQVDETTDPVDETTDEAQDVAEDDDDGFDWGLLGLLGLLGLAGLFRRPQPVVHRTEPAGTRTAGDVDDTRV